MPSHRSDLGFALRPGVLSGALFVMLVAAVISVVVAQTQRIVHTERDLVSQEVSLRAGLLGDVLRQRTVLLVNLEEFVLSELPEDPDAERFDDLAAGIHDRTPGVRAIQLAPDFVIEYVYPIEGNEASFGHDLMQDERPRVREDVELALTRSEPVFSGPYELRQGGLGVVSRTAIRRPTGSIWGLGIVVLDVPDLMVEAGLDDNIGLRMALLGEDGEVFWGDEAVLDEDPVRFSVSLPGETWTLLGVPADGWIGYLTSEAYLFWLMGAGVVILGTVLIWVLHSRQVVLARAVEESTESLARANQSLAERLEAEESAKDALRLSEARFRQLWEDAPIAMATARDGLTMGANRAFAELFGYSSAADVDGTQTLSLVTPEEHDRVEQILVERGVLGGPPISEKTIGLRGDGTTFPMHMDLSVVQLGEEATVVGFFSDLTAQVEHDRLLVEQQAVFRALFESSPVPLFEEDFSVLRSRLLEMDGEPEEIVKMLENDLDLLSSMASGMVVVRANAAAQQLAAVDDQGQIIGDLGPVISELNRDLFIEQVLAICHGDESFRGTGQLSFADGEPRDITLFWTVEAGSEETYEHIFVSIIDVSELVRVQRELERYRATLEEQVEERTAELSEALERLKVATESKDRFLASMSHELRTPLNSIIGFSGTMLQGLAGELTDEQERQLGWISRSGRHLLTLINQILDLAKIESGHIEVQLREVNVEDAAREVAEEVSSLIQDKGLTLDLDVEEGIPPLVSDPHRLHQVLLNLMANAVKFTSEGGVGLAVRTEGEDVRFEVSDTGKGVDVTDRDQIFAAFYQSESDRALKPSGTGLGLAISREIAEVLGGSLELASTSTSGSKFILRVPLAGPEKHHPRYHETT